MKRVIYTIYCLLFVSVLSSCDDWLDVQPITQIEGERLFETKEGFETSLTGIYLKLGDKELYGSSLSMKFVEILAQRFDLSGAIDHWASEIAEYQYGHEDVEPRIRSVWSHAYNTIAECNLLLEEIENREDLFTTKEYKLYKGELLAIRGMLHFDILRLFGPMPGTDYDKEFVPYYTEFAFEYQPYLIPGKFLQMVINDLSSAENLLQDSDPILEDGPFMEESDVTVDKRFWSYRADRMNLFSVQGLLARVHLYNRDRINALEYANKVIDGNEGRFPFVDQGSVIGAGGVVSNPNCIFSTEVLFALNQMDLDFIQRDLFSDEISQEKRLLPTKNSLLFQSVIFDDEMVDYRFLPSWRKGTTAPYYHFSKYKVIDQSSLFSNRIPMVRLSEAYLIAAECETHPDNARKYLNMLRSARGLSDYITGTIEEGIRKEYIREFMGEGQLFYYYKRTNAEQILSGSLSTTISMTSAQYVLPLPNNEVNNRK